VDRGVGPPQPRPQLDDQAGHRDTWRAPETVAASVPDGCLIVLGDNAEMSMDSRYLGYIPGEPSFGIVVASLPRRPGSTDDQMRNGLVSRPQESSVT